MSINKSIDISTNKLDQLQQRQQVTREFRREGGFFSLIDLEGTSASSSCSSVKLTTTLLTETSKQSTTDQRDDHPHQQEDKENEEGKEGVDGEADDSSLFLRSDCFIFSSQQQQLPVDIEKIEEIPDWKDQ